MSCLKKLFSIAMQTKSVLPFLAVRFEQFKKAEEMKVALAIAQNMWKWNKGMILWDIQVLEPVMMVAMQMEVIILPAKCTITLPILCLLEQWKWRIALLFWKMSECWGCCGGNLMKLIPETSLPDANVEIMEVADAIKLLSGSTVPAVGGNIGTIETKKLAIHQRNLQWGGLGQWKVEKNWSNIYIALSFW
jgi:hypothetical protein